MSEIRTAEERIHPMALDDKSVWCNAYFDEVAELRAQNEALRDEIEKLNQENIKIENERDKLKQDFDDLQERFNGIKFIESELRKENDSLNTQIAGLKNELLESLKDWHELITNEEKLKQENEKQAKRIAEMKAEDEISAAVIKKCSNLLAQIAITIKGEPKKLSRHSYHDLPELVLVLHVENELNKNRILGQSDEIEALRKQVEESNYHLQTVIDDISLLMKESDGVIGLHLNNDIAHWDSLMRGGCFEDWLISLDNAKEYLTPSTKED